MAYSLRSAVKGSTVYTAGSLLVRATGFLLVPIYTRFLTPSDYGIIAILNALIVVISPVLALGLPASQTRLYYDMENDRSKIGELVFTLNTIVFLLSLIVCLLLTFFGERLFGLFIDLEAIPFRPYLLIVTWTLFLSVANQYIPSLYIAMRKYVFTAVLQVVSFVLSASFIILFVVVKRQGALGSVKGVLIGNAAIFVLFYWYYARNFVWRFNVQYAKDGIRLGLPVVIHTTAAAMTLTVDRFVIQRFMTLDDVGLYSLACKFGLILSVITVSANRAWIPNYYELMKQEERDRGFELRRVAVLWLTVMGLLCIAGSLWSREIIELMTTERYFAASVVVPFVLVGYFFQSIFTFLIAQLFYFKKTVLLSVLSMVGMVVNLVLNFLLVPRIGIVGAAVATIAAFVCASPMAFTMARRLFDPGFDITRLLVLVVAVTATSIASAYLDANIVIRFLVPVAYLLLSYALFQPYLGPMARKGLSYLRLG